MLSCLHLLWHEKQCEEHTIQSTFRCHVHTLACTYIEVLSAVCIICFDNLCACSWSTNLIHSIIKWECHPSRSQQWCGASRQDHTQSSGTSQ